MKSYLKHFCAVFIIILYTSFSYSTSFANNDSVNMNSPAVEAEGVILIDAGTGIMVYGKNENQKYYPASTTKVMTTLLTMEYVESRGGDYTERIRFSENAVFGIERGSNHIAMDVDETLTMEEALYAIMLASANEVSAALAEHIGGSVEGFAKLMNKRAAELGLRNTNFVNPHGLHDDNHYTTPADLAVIMREAVKHELFLELIGTKQRYIPPTEKQPEERPLNNSNRLILGGAYYDPSVVGGKTGYTDEARHTLVSYAKQGDAGMICAVMKAEKNIPYTDSIALYEYGFSLYQALTVLDAKDYQTETEIYAADGTVKRLTMVPEKSVTAYLPSTIDLEAVEKVPVYETAPIFDAAVGRTGGLLEIQYQGHTLGEVELRVLEVSVENTPTIQKEGKERAVFSETAPLGSKQEGGTGGWYWLPFAAMLGLLLALSAWFLSWRRRQSRVAARIRHKRQR